ncbi:MAG: PDGLE domain-containing protein [Dehalococcoidia bacterium]
MKLRWWIVGYFIAIAVALISPLASGNPDGMERVAEDQGFIEESQEAGYQIIPDYVFPGIENEAVATMIAGVAGTTILYVLVAGAAYLALRRKKPAANTAGTG